MKRTYLILLASLLALGLAACGDDESTTPGTSDVTSESTPPTGGTTETPPTTGSLPTTETTPTSGNGTTTTTPPNGTTTSSSTELLCTTDQIERGGTCVDPVDYDEYEFSGVYSWISRIQAPTDEVECCFSYTAPDDAIDNVLAALLDLLPQLAGDLDLQAELDEAIENDSFALLLEYRDLPADFSGTSDPFGINVYIASNTNDGEDDPRDSIAVREAGDGVFTLSEASVDDFGAQVQFNNAIITDGVMTAGPSTFILQLDLGDLVEGLFDEPLTLTIEQARLLATITQTDKGVETVDEVIEGETFGGGRLGGVIPVQQIIDIVNDLAADCTCADGVNDGEDVLVGFEDDEDGFFIVECPNANIIDSTDCTDEDGDVCGFLEDLCSFAPIIGDIIDIDTTGSGIPDSLSVGLFLSMVGASIHEDDPFADSIPAE